MGYQEVGGSLLYKPWKEWQEDDFIEGVYQSSKVDRFGKDNYIIKVIESNIEGFKKDKLVCLNNTGSLEYKLNEAGVEPGYKVFIQYLGLDKIKKGAFAGKDYHNLKVMFDANNSSAEL